MARQLKIEPPQPSTILTILPSTFYYLLLKPTTKEMMKKPPPSVPVAVRSFYSVSVLLADLNCRLRVT